MKKNKKAFSLLEVLLAMAIMVIASVMILQGYMSTLTYSGNTEVYAKNAVYNTNYMYTTVAQKSGKNGDTADAGSGTASISLASASAVNFSVNTWSATSASIPTFSSAYTEAGALTTSKYAVTYCLPAGLKCPKCNSSEHLARDKNHGLKWYCTVCNEHIT